LLPSRQPTSILVSASDVSAHAPDSLSVVPLTELVATSALQSWAHDAILRATCNDRTGMLPMGHRWDQHAMSRWAIVCVVLGAHGLFALFLSQMRQARR